MADNEDARPIPDTHSSLADGSRARMGRAPRRGIQNHKSGPGLQTNDRRPRAIPSRDIDTEYMVVRRFALLHTRGLLRMQNGIAEIEDRVMRLDGNANDQLPSPTLGQGSASRESQIEEKLSEYNSMISRMESLKRTPRPSADRYESVRDFLKHGPPIYMHYSEIQDDRWRSYQSAVGEVLRDPQTSAWLNGYMDLELPERKGRQWWRECNRGRVHHTLSISKVKSGVMQMATGALVLFWITHITSALGFLLIANTSDSVNPHRTGDTSRSMFPPLAMYLLAYWYISAVSIVLQGLLGKGFVYARKTFLGGVLACLGGLYILRVLIGVSPASSLTALPTLFTVVLLLIQTM